MPVRTLFNAIKCGLTSLQSIADALAKICNEREESIHCNLHLGKMFEVSGP